MTTAAMRKPAVPVDGAAQKNIAMIVPYARSVVHFRGPLIEDLLAHGHRVRVFAPDWRPEQEAQVRAMGAQTVRYPLSRTSLNPLSDLRALWALYRALGEDTDAVVTFQPKANVYGILAAYLANVEKRVPVVTGLGFAFTPGVDTHQRRLIRAVQKMLYRVSFGRADVVFFQNADDIAEFQGVGVLSSKKARLLGATGLRLSEWSEAPPHVSPITFTLIARLLKEKGIPDFAEAARHLKRSRPELRFRLIGPLDTNPGAISEEEVQGWVREGLLEWVPWTDDVRPYLAETSVYVLPSYYREGVPRSTQEAMAMGRPVITTDAPGCRETVVEGVSGYLVPPQDPPALAAAMERFIREPGLIETMGRESRRLAEERFDARVINARLIAVIEGREVAPA